MDKKKSISKLLTSAQCNYKKKKKKIVNLSRSLSSVLLPLVDVLIYSLGKNVKGRSNKDKRKLSPQMSARQKHVGYSRLEDAGNLKKETAVRCIKPQNSNSTW